MLLTFWLGDVLRATTACNFSSLILPDGSAPAALASLLFDPPEPQNIRETQSVFLDFSTFSRTCIFFLLWFFWVRNVLFLAWYTGWFVEALCLIRFLCTLHDSLTVKLRWGRNLTRSVQAFNNYRTRALAPCICMIMSRIRELPTWMIGCCVYRDDCCPSWLILLYIIGVFLLNHSHNTTLSLWFSQATTNRFFTGRPEIWCCT